MDNNTTDFNRIIQDVKPKTDEFSKIIGVELKKYSPENYKKVIEILQPVLQNYNFYKPEVQKSLIDKFKKIESDIIKSYNRDKDVKDLNSLFSAYSKYIINSLNDFITQTNITNNIDQQRNNSNAAKDDSSDSIEPYQIAAESLKEDKDKFKELIEYFKLWFNEIEKIAGIDSEYNDIFKLAAVYSYIDMRFNNTDKNKHYIESYSKSIAKLRDLFVNNSNNIIRVLRDKINDLRGVDNTPDNLIEKLYRQLRRIVKGNTHNLMENKLKLKNNNK